MEAELKAATLNYRQLPDGRVATTLKTSIPELSNDDMLALTSSQRANLRFEVVIDTEDGENDVPTVIFAVGDKGPLAFTSLANHSPTQ
jgi:hypothetical protein